MSTEQQLIKKISNFNKESYKDIIKISLSNYVDYIKCPCCLDYDSELENLEYKNFFLLKKEKKYIGIVEETNDDIYVVLESEYRKNNSNIINELNDTIIPFLMKDGNDQKMTFLNDKLKEHFINKLLNIEIHNDGAIIHNSKKKEFKYTTKNKLSLDEFEKIKLNIIKINKLHNILKRSRRKRPYVSELLKCCFISDYDCKIIFEEFHNNNSEIKLYKRYINYYKKNNTHFLQHISLIYNKDITLVNNLIDDLIYDFDEPDLNLEKLNNFTLLELEYELSLF